jgi:hypothetical protein
MKQKKKATRGGKRKGSGRKPLSYTTQTIRVATPIVPDVKKLNDEFKANNK